MHVSVGVDYMGQSKRVLFCLGLGAFVSPLRFSGRLCVFGIAVCVCGSLEKTRERTDCTPRARPFIKDVTKAEADVPPLFGF